MYFGFGECSGLVLGEGQGVWFGDDSGEDLGEKRFFKGEVEVEVEVDVDAVDVLILGLKFFILLNILTRFSNELLGLIL